jgi:glyoxylase-like metal-dependent hydrolase (beta-lactamase superfamily II)
LRIGEIVLLVFCSHQTYHTSRSLLSMESQTSSFIKQSAFQASRLTPSTFLIKEYDDVYSEHPHIYAKVVPSANTMLVIDTGCGGASNNPKTHIKSLREFMETVRVDENNNKPLNQGGRMKYLVVTTHCHYDHIRMRYPLYAVGF